MKLACHENNWAAINVGRPAPCTILCFDVHPTVECLNRNVFYWSVAPTHFKIYCGLLSVKAKNANKTK